MIREMNFSQFLKKIGMPEEAAEELRKGPVDESEYLRWKDLFEKNLQFFLLKLGQREDAARKALFLYAHFAFDAHSSFRENGVSDEIYYDTCSDLTIWTLDYHEKNGVWGLSELEWLSKSIRQELYRLGRLQFEPVTEEAWEEIRRLYRPEFKLPNVKLLNVHIPAGETLDPLEVRESFDRAGKFFPAAEGMVCISWLLSPELRKLLPEQSRILSFQRQFHVIKVIHPFRQAEERVFGKILDNPEDYPEDTSLQKALKEYVMNKKEPGIGLGFLAF